MTEPRIVPPEEARAFRDDEYLADLSGSLCWLDQRDLAHTAAVLGEENAALREQLAEQAAALAAQRDRSDEWKREHALANSGCVPGDAYRSLADEMRKSAWQHITGLAARHRHCDCSGGYPCEVRQLVDRFGREWCTCAALAGEQP